MTNRIYAPQQDRPDQSAAMAVGAAPNIRSVLPVLEQLAHDRKTEPEPATSLEQILAQVDGIMLPREVMVFADGQAELPVASLIVSQRRLVGLALPDGWRGDLVDGLRRLLAQLEGRRLQFRSFVAQAPIGAESLSANAIRGHLQLHTSSPADALERFRQAAAPLCSDWIFLAEGKLAGKGGSVEKVDRLQQVAHRLSAPGHKEASFGLRPSLMILMATPGARLVVARADRLCFLAVLPLPALEDVVAAWQVLFQHQR